MFQPWKDILRDVLKQALPHFPTGKLVSLHPVKQDDLPNRRQRLDRSDTHSTTYHLGDSERNDDFLQFGTSLKKDLVLFSRCCVKRAEEVGFEVRSASDEEGRVFVERVVEDGGGGEDVG